MPTHPRWIRWSRCTHAWSVWRTVVGVTGVILVSGCGRLLGVRALETARPGLTTYHELRVDGRTRRFLLHLPPVATSRRVPLVLAFHGYKGNGAVLRESSQLDVAADSLGFAVAYPDGTGRFGFVGLSWNAGTCCGRAHEDSVDDIAFADSLVATLRRSVPIDSAHTYAVGFSAGGMLALRLGCLRSATFTAVADIAGAMPDETCRPTQRMSVLLVQGAEDDELRHDLRRLRKPRGFRFSHSLELALRFWAGQTGCDPNRIDRDSSATIVIERAVNCPSGHAVELMTVAEHPHAWPGGRSAWFFAPRPAKHLDASLVTLEFFRDVARGTRPRHVDAMVPPIP